MVQIDFLEILKAIRMCKQNPKYKVGVFMPTIPEVKYVYDEIVNAICEDKEGKNTVIGHIAQLRSRIEFNNGSTIQFVLASESARGCKFNHVLYGKDIKSDILHNVVKHTEFTYKEITYD